MTNAKVEAYIGRSTAWPAELAALRDVLLGAGLTEELKWGKPCYAADGANIAIMQEMKSFLALMFFKGALMPDPDGLLEEQGPNSRSAKRITFTSVDDITRLAAAVERYVAAAIAVEASGATVAPAPAWSPVDALQERLDADAAFCTAFGALTPGRQREYHLHISSAKQLDTRRSRVEKLAPQILAGKGLRDR